MALWVRRPWVWVLVGVCWSWQLRLRRCATPRCSTSSTSRSWATTRCPPTRSSRPHRCPAAQPLLGLPVDEIESRIETLDAVAAARVVRDWPDRVKIVVRERRPVGYVESSGGVALVGSDGSLYREQQQTPTDVPELPLAAGASIGVGDAYPPDAGEEAQAAFDVAVSLPRTLQRSVDRRQLPRAQERCGSGSVTASSSSGDLPLRGSRRRPS